MRQSVFQNISYYLFLLFCSFLILFLDRQGILMGAKRLVQTITSPIQYGMHETGLTIQREFGLIWNLRLLEKQNRDLVLEKSALEGRIVRLEETLKFSSDLKKQFEAVEPQKFKILPAKLVGWGRFIEINKGVDDGIKKDQVVIWKDALVGRIFLVGPKTSQVQTIFDPGLKVPAVTLPKEDRRAKGVVGGRFGREAFFEHVLQEEKMEVGDLVLTSGENGKFPLGLIIGRIKSVSSQEADVFQSALITPLFDYQNLDTVFVILE